jgi:hypothetical protein
VLGIALTGCGSDDVAVPHPTGAAASACASFMDALPSSLADQPLRSTADDGPQASYGDPAIVVSCGVPSAAGFELGAQCELANGVGWYLPSEQYDDQGVPATVYAAGYSPLVEAVVPARYRPAGIAAVMAQLAGPVKQHLTKTEGCV